MRQRGRPRHDDILTPREWEVLNLLREGLTNEQIAARLGVTHDTAKFHVSEILGKLGVESRQDAARWAERQRRWGALGLPAALLRKIASVPAWKLAGGAVIVATAVALGALAVAVLLADSSSTPEATGPLPTQTPESLTGDEVLDRLVQGLLQDDTAQLALRFAGVTAREGQVIGGPVGLYQVEPVATSDWTARLGGMQRTLIGVVEPLEPDNPAPIPGGAPLPSALLFDQQRDYDIVLLARSETIAEQPWRFSVRDGEVIDVIIDRVAIAGENAPGPYPLIYRLYSLMPSPDEEPGRFLILPPEEYWPIPERVGGSGPPTPQPGREPSMAPDGRTGDAALDSVIEMLVYGRAADLEHTLGRLAARQVNCVPIPDTLGACSIEYQRISPADWIAQFTAAARSLYAVVDHEPDVIVIAADTGLDSADGWRFGVDNGEVLDVELRKGEAMPPLPAGASPDPGFFWQQVRFHTPDPVYSYYEFLVLPPRQALPQPLDWHDFSVRTGDPGVDSLIALIESGDAGGLIAAAAPQGQITLRGCQWSGPPQDNVTIEDWARHTVERAIKVHAVSNVPEGYHPTAQHVIEVVLEVNPVRWQGTAILEANGEIVEVLTGEDCFLGQLSPGPRNYLIPPLDVTLQQFDSSRRSGVPIIDEVLDAMQSGLESDWEGLVEYSGIPCGYDYTPPCPPGAALGSPVEAFPTSACHGGYMTREDPPRPRMGGDSGTELYAVVEYPSQGSTGYPHDEASIAVILVFDRNNNAASAITVTAGGISDIRMGCGTYHPEWFTPQGTPDYLLPPPPGP